jgi:hypothetical protein
MISDFFNSDTDSKGGIIDSSLSEFMDSSLTFEESKTLLIDTFTSINQVRFQGNSIKQKIYVYVDRINGCCPYCGDSMSDPYKKRGNIILKGEHAGHYKCFNCAIYKSINDFLTDFKITPNLELINYIHSITTEHIRDSYRNYDISILLNQNEIDEYAIGRNELKAKFSFIEAEENGKILSWLKSRLHTNLDNFLYNEEYNYLVILNRTNTKKIIGFQIRNFNKSKEKYKTFNLNQIYKLMKIEKEIPDSINTFSQLFGLFQLNFNLPITVFEGPMDSYLFPNSIAMLGINKKFPIDMSLRYFYDDDKIGRKKSIELLNKREFIFLWGKFKSDVGLPYRLKWDLNDVKIWAYNNVILPNFNDYFSQEPLDVIDI